MGPAISLHKLSLPHGRLFPDPRFLLCVPIDGYNIKINDVECVRQSKVAKSPVAFYMPISYQSWSGKERRIIIGPWRPV